MKDIQPGEQLRVWYAPYYAVKMGAVPFNIDLTADVSTNINTPIFLVSTTRNLRNLDTNKERQKAVLTFLNGKCIE